MKKLIFYLLLTGFGINHSEAQCACCGGAPSGFSGGESTPGVYALQKKKWLAELYADYRSFNGVSQAKFHPEHVSEPVSTGTSVSVSDMLIGIAGIRYGVTDNIAVSVQQPYFTMNTASGGSHSFGDLLSLVNYMPANKGRIMIALQAGIEAPTGRMTVINGGAPIPTGSGSFDPVAGISLMKAAGRSLFRVNAFYKKTCKGYSDIFFGDFFGYTLNYTYYFSEGNSLCAPDSLGGGKNKPRLGISVRLAGEWSQMQMKQNVYIENTGSYIASASLGTILALGGSTFSFNFTAPLYQYFHGVQNKTLFRIQAGITKYF